MREHVHDGYSFQGVEDALLFSEEDVFQDEIELSSTRQEVEALLSDLSPREKQVLSLRYDLNDEIGGIRTLEEVGHVVGDHGHAIFGSDRADRRRHRHRRQYVSNQ